MAVIVGMNPGEELRVPMSFMQNREITLTGTFRYANTYADAIALVASGRIDIRSLVTGHYSLETAEQALQATKKDPTNIKSIVAPSH
jgi:L-iditol 2-dehydrogenase